MSISPLGRSSIAPKPPWNNNGHSSYTDTSLETTPAPSTTIGNSVDKLPSFGGHGTVEILEVTKALEEHGIPCCLTGTSALIYYGADRCRNDWEICVPTEQLNVAGLLLQSDIFKGEYVQVDSLSNIQLRSLFHIFPRFKCKGHNLFFLLVPSKDAHIECRPSNFQRSSNGLPYPKLDVFIQSLLDTHDLVALCDAVDGSNISEEWGHENPNLEGSNDLEWV